MDIKIKIIPEFPNYEVYSDGRIRSIKSNIFLTPVDNGAGYMHVNLHKKGKQICKYVHRLVAYSFLENPNNYKYVDHIDRDKSNNKLQNLRFVTPSENTRNTAGKPRYSVKRTHCKQYPNEVVEKIKGDYKNGSRVSQISKKYNIPRQSVSRFIKETK